MITDEAFQHDKLSFEISYISEKGGRPVNEDCVKVADAEERIFLSVADGLGAHGGGDIAAKIAAEISCEEYLKNKKTNVKTICSIFSKINDEITKKQTDEIEMKTTLACVLYKGRKIYASHLGDTRIYTFKNEKETYLTADHSLAYDEIMHNGGALDDIRNNPDRHILKAALGVADMRVPDMFRQRVKSGMALLICSDGFWEYVKEDEMLDALAETKTARQWLEKMLECYSARISEYKDNYSAICLRIKRI